jgi:hypothetical protein
MANLYIIEAETNGGGSASLPTIGSLAPPNPPTLAYFVSKNTKFTNVQIRPAQAGRQNLLVRSSTDTVLIYSDTPVSVRTGNVPGAPIALTAGIANAQYLNRSAFKAA